MSFYVVGSDADRFSNIPPENVVKFKDGINTISRAPFFSLSIRGCNNFNLAKVIDV